MECSRCGTSGEKTIFFDVIDNGGIIKVCERCAREINLPIVGRPSNYQLKEAERHQTVYERMVRMTKVDPRKRNKGLNEQDMKLRRIVEKNHKEKITTGSTTRENNNLVRNFHWEIMMARRKKKISQEQLANIIQEPELSIKMIEKGIVPKDYHKLVNKLESYFKISLLKSSAERAQSRRSEELGFDKYSVNEMNVGDLKGINLDEEGKPIEGNPSEKKDGFFKKVLGFFKKSENKETSNSAEKLLEEA